jgi:2-deoxy-D-gluconate 3-dehydrogenase
MQLFNLIGKKALITGGGSGIGLGMAEGLAEAGADVVLVNRSESADTQAVRLKNLGYRAFSIRSDLAKGEEEIDQVFEETLKLLGGRLDILINSAGTTFMAPPEEFPVDEFDRVMNLNLRTLFLTCKRVGMHMLKNGSGRIINVASMLSFFGGNDVPAYAASKGAVAQLTKTLSNAWSGRGINVNAVAPGFIETKLTGIRLTNNPPAYRKVQDRIPIGRWGYPEDLKGIAVFLASQASAYITGAVIPVDGGYLSN